MELDDELLALVFSNGCCKERGGGFSLARLPVEKGHVVPSHAFIISQWLSQ